MVWSGAPKQQNRKLIRNGQRKTVVSPTLVIGGVFMVIVSIYVTAVTWFSVSSSSPLHQSDSNSVRGQQKDNTNIIDPPSVAELKALEELKNAVKSQNRHPIVRNFKAKPKGEGINPQALLADNNNENDANEEPEPEHETHPDPDHIMKAFLEPIKFQDWEVKPLPVRTTAREEQLQEMAFPKVNACSKLPERWPADEYNDADTFLPWIHDVFPTDDGKFIQFVAQNRRRCHTGTTDSELEILFRTQPSVTLFQHVPVQRIQQDGETRYKLTTHEKADPDGVATRFICRFKPTMEETLSVFNFDYDWAAHRKKLKHTFKFDDGGIKSVHTSQLIFQCPVPEGLQEKIRTGESVVNDFATLFVDLVPIRTPPRYGVPHQFLQPRYNQSVLQFKAEDLFDPVHAWGDDHILPKIEDSGRWENIPICKPSLPQFEPEGSNEVAISASENDSPAKKKHKLVSCLWASAGYATRGNRFAINDGQRRLLEWVHFNKMLGFDHFYVYDNSYAFSNDITLKPIADLFPDEITYIKWPFQVCNNNPNNVDSPGERSSQYAAEASCRLRFGPHVEWIGQFDIDEYLVPMGSYTSILPLLDKLDSEGNKIVSFGSWRAWPRRDFIE
jgi:Glycosyltransferase family 92